MSSMEATISMLEALPEESRILVLEFTKRLFAAARQNESFSSLDDDKSPHNQEVSRNRIAQGQGLDVSASPEHLRRNEKGMRGVLAQYANPVLAEKEKGAWERAMVEKYGNA